jgi:hypothetical protein
VSGIRYVTAVLGGGAVGMIAALGSARHTSTVLVLRSNPGPTKIPRIETIPAPILSLLIDHGVHPRRIGVDRLYESQFAAWQCADPELRRGRAMAHIDKAKLESELLRLCSRAPRLDIVIDSHGPFHGHSGWCGSNWSAQRMVDATGRAAATATHRVAAAKPWVARPFWSPVPAPAAQREFKIAALPDGYAYRVGSNEVDSLWIAGRGPLLSSDPKTIQASIISAGAGWLLEGLPGPMSWHCGRAFPVSVQWAEGPAIAVGDAALARDALSSQGMAAGLSSACYAAACESDRDATSFREHQRAERASHLRSLLQLISTCRHGDSAEWQRYQQFVATHQCDAKSQNRVCPSQGRLKSSTTIV